MIMQEATTTATRKPILKVTIGGKYVRPEICYAYLLELPGVFQRIGTSDNPAKLTDGLQKAFGYELILRQARAFSDRNQALGYETKLHKKYSESRIAPPPFASPRSSKYYAPGVEIHL